MIPGAADREVVDTIVFDELTQGIMREESRRSYLDVIDQMAADGAEAVVLACTEIGLLIGPGDSPLPLIDSAEVHARELGRVALGELVAR